MLKNLRIFQVYKLRIFNNEPVCLPKLVQLKEISDKRVIFHNVRNIQQSNDGIYETQELSNVRHYLIITYIK